MQRLAGFRVVFSCVFGLFAWVSVVLGSKTALHNLSFVFLNHVSRFTINTFLAL